MIKNNTLFGMLMILIVLDYGTTFVAVLYLGARELNPFYMVFDNLYHFFIFKFTAGIFCISTMFYYEQDFRKIINIGLIIINGFYLVVVTSNFYQIFTNIF